MRALRPSFCHLPATYALPLLLSMDVTTMASRHDMAASMRRGGAILAASGERRHTAELLRARRRYFVIARALVVVTRGVPLGV